MTRVTVTLILFAALMINAQAEEPSVIDLCRDLSLVAKEVMTAKQEMEPMSEVLPATMKQLQKWAAKYGLEMNSQDAEELSAPLVMAAYDVRDYPDGSAWNEERQDAIRNFENESFEECYEKWTSE